MKHKSRIILPILTFLTFGMVTGSVVVADYVKQETKEANAHSITGGKVYFVDNPGWGNVYVHAFHGSTSEHPWGSSVKMTDTGYTFREKKIYEYTLEDSATTHVIFKNAVGDTSDDYRTGDLELQSGDTCLYDIYGNKKSGDSGTWRAYKAGINPDMYEKEIIARKPDGWSWGETTYCYAYYNNDWRNNTWPGYAMDYMGQYGGYHYYHTYTKLSYINVIINDNKGNQIEFSDIGCNFYEDNILYDLETSTIKKFKVEFATTGETDSANWQTLGSERNDTYLRKYFTNGSVNQVCGQKIYMRFNIDNGTSKQVLPVTSIGTAGDKGANNVANDASTRPTFKYSGVFDYIDFYWSKADHNFYVHAKGIGNDRYDIIRIRNGVSTFYETSYDGSYKYPDGDYYGRWELELDDMQLNDTIHIFNSVDSVGAYNEFAATYVNSNGYFDASGVCQRSNKYMLYIEKDSSNDHNVNVLHTDRLTGDVVFNANGHGVAPSGYTDIDKGSTISAPTAPTSTEYDFAGWYKQAGCTEAWNFAEDTLEDDVTTLYAKWTGKQFNITYGKNDGDFVFKVDTGRYGESFGIHYTSPNLDPGYTWHGAVLYVYPGTDRSQDPLATKNIDVANPSGDFYFTMTGTYYSDVYVYLEWSRTPNNYTVTLDKGTGTGGPDSVTATYKQYLPKGITLPTKPGYTFGGYWENEGGTGKQYYSSEGYVFATWENASDGTIYAKWNQFYAFNVAITDGLNLKGTLEQDYISDNGVKYIDVHYPNCDELTGAFLDKRYTITDASVDFEDLCVPVNAAQLTDNITLTLKKSDESPIETINVSVAFVLNEKIIEGVKTGTEAGTKKANLCASIMLYGSCVQVVYNHNMGDLAHNRITDATTKAYVMSLFNSKTLVDDPEDSYNNNDGLFDMATVGSAAGLNTTINYRFYFQCSNEDLENYEFSWAPDVGGKLSGVEWDGEVHTEVINKVTWRYYELTGFKPTDTHDMFTITITKGGKTFTADYSIYAYLYKVYNTSTYSNYVSIAKSLEVYHDTAVAYVG